MHQLIPALPHHKQLEGHYIVYLQQTIIQAENNNGKTKNDTE